MRLSLVIPAYNETSCLEAVLAGVVAYLDAQPYDAEVVVVDDGSTDGTHEIAEGYAGHTSTKVCGVRLPENRGKGFAVRTGMLEHAGGEYRVFFDADGSTPIEEIEKLWPRFDAGADIVIGSRALPDSDIAVRQRWYREAMGRTFNAILHVMGLTRFKDTQCGFKAFTAAACETVFSRQTLERFSFDVELLHIAQRHGLRVEEIPVVWRNVAQSRLHPLLDSLQMFWDLLKIRIRGWRGRYD